MQSEVELIHPWDVYELMRSVPEIELVEFEGLLMSEGSEFEIRGKKYRQTAYVEPKTTNIR